MKGWGRLCRSEFFPAANNLTSKRMASYVALYFTPVAKCCYNKQQTANVELVWASMRYSVHLTGPQGNGKCL